jgi:glycosyltransferase involved in cell wall biosynthesis
MKLISFAVPSYNSQDYLRHCVDTLLSGGEDVEILIVNDGSTDGTAAVAGDYCRRSPLIQYIHHPNGGVSAARNHGLALARSEFVSFVDSDDYVMPGYFETLDRIGDHALLVFDRCHTGGEARDDSAVFARLALLDQAHDLRLLLMQSKKIMQPWNKCFRLSVIRRHGLAFPTELHIAEDFVFCMRYALACGSIAISREKAYCVDVSDGSSLSRRYRADLAGQLSRAVSLVEDAIRDSHLPENQQADLLARLDELHTRNMLMSVAELFKATGHPGRSRVRAVCAPFLRPCSPCRLGRQHRILRLMLRLRLYGCLALLAWVVRGRQYRKEAARG